MKIRILESSSAIPFAKPGVFRDVNDALARHVISLGIAEAADSDPAEMATVAAPETAAARPRRKYTKHFKRARA